MSTDEMTGIQALERKHRQIGMGPARGAPGIRIHPPPTLTLIANFDVAQGRIVASSMGPTRTEEDFVAHIQQTVASDSEVTRWHFVTDNLNTHQSANLALWRPMRASKTTGQKGPRGILKSGTRAGVSRQDHAIALCFTKPIGHLDESD